MDKESAIVIAPDPSRDRQVSIDPEQVIQMQKAVQNVFKQIDLSYLSAANKTLQKAMSEPLTKISQLPFQQMSESINVAMNQLRESMANIQQIHLNLLITTAQQIRELQLDPSDLLGSLKDIDWDALNALDDDEIVPEKIQAPVQKIAKTLPIASAEHKAMTKKDVWKFLLDLIIVISFFVGTPYDWFKDYQAAKSDEQQILDQRLFEQKALEFFQGTFENTQRIVDLLESGNVIVLDDGNLLEDSIESECGCKCNSEKANNHE